MYKRGTKDITRTFCENRSDTIQSLTTNITTGILGRDSLNILLGIVVRIEKRLKDE